jgi:serine protease Do
MTHALSRLSRRWAALSLVALLALTTQACAQEGNQNNQPAAQATATLSNLPNFSKLVESSAPAVVSITGVRTINNGSAAANVMPNLPPNSPFRQFFKHFFDQQQGPNSQPQQSKERILGSGFIISSDGYIVTNRHVVVGDTELKVRLLDRHEYSAKVIGMDKRTDLALLKINAKGLPTLALGDSGKLKVGQWILAIGNPFGFDYSATQGIISALSRNLPNENYVPFIQTDAAVNPGNSGGPLLNLKGQVIGVNSQIYTNSGGFMGLSFAIPINIVKDVVAQIKAHGKVSYGWLGVMVQDMNQSLAQSFGLKQPEGALVAQVVADSPAAKAGLQAGDIILAFNGSKIGRSGDLPPLVGATPVGTSVPVSILRNGKRLTVDVTIAALKEPKAAQKSPPTSPTDQGGRLGIIVENLTADQRKQLDIGNHGVLISGVDPNGIAAQSGLEPGDVILQFGRAQINDSAELTKQVHDAPTGQPIPVLILREKTPLYTTVTIPKGK